MSEFFTNILGNGNAALYGNAILLTLKITLLSTLLSYIIGIPLGVILYGTSKGGV